MCSSAPQLSFSTLVSKTQRYCCWTDWVFFLEAMRSAANMVVWSLQLCHCCFFYRLVFDGAVIFRIVLLLLHTSSHFFGGPTIRVALLHNWDVLPWLLRQRDCWWTSLVLFWEDHAFSYKHGCLIPSTLSLMFFYRLLIDEALSPVLFYISLTPRPIFLGPLCVALLHNWDFLPWLLRQRYCCWTDWVFFWEDHAFSYKDVCLIPSTLSVMFFYRLVFDGAVIFRIVLLLLHTSSPFLGPTIRVALLHHWDVLPWLLRQSDIGAGLIGSSSEKAMRSATNMVVWSVQLCHWCFFTG